MSVILKDYVSVRPSAVGDAVFVRPSAVDDAVCVRLKAVVHIMDTSELRNKTQNFSYLRQPTRARANVSTNCITFI